MNETAKGALVGQIVQVGPRYGIRDYLKTIESAYDGAGPMGGGTAIEGLRRSLTPAAIADSLDEEYASSNLEGSILSTSRTESKRLGRPMLDHWIEVAFTAMIRALDDSGRTEPALGTMRITHRIQRDRVMIESVRLNAYLTVHALERLYERESMKMGGMPEAVSATIAGMHHGMAVACREGIGLVAGEQNGHIAISARCPATMLVAFGDGLLVVEMVPALTFGDPVSRYEVRNGRIHQRPSPEASFPGTPMPDGPTDRFGQITFIGRTYLSRDILRPEQIEYLDLFVDMMRNDDQRSRIRDFFHLRERHAGHSIGDQLDQDKTRRLKTLLPGCIAMGPNVHKMFAITRRLPGESMAQPVSYNQMANHVERSKHRYPSCR